jgi:hypothetical protein
MSWLPLPRAAALALGGGGRGLSELALGGGGLSALLAGAPFVVPDEQRRREAFFKRVVRQLLIGVVCPGELQSQ